jgi:anaerobic magnesium-protoporphyrin IX monomethyl ester cyclase
MAKIALIYFDISTGYYPSFHHGLAFLMGALRDRHEVFFHHLALPGHIEDVSARVAGERADIVGLSFATNQVRHVKEFLRSWKRKDEKLVIAGGVHPTLEREKIFETFQDIDGICLGEGEISFSLLCDRMERDEDFWHIPGFLFRRKEQMIENPVMELPDIESLSFPDYSRFNYKKIIQDNGEIFPMAISRGCPYDCFYCCNHALRKIYKGSRTYSRIPSPSHALSLIQHNLKLYPFPKKIDFADDTFTFTKKWLKDFCHLYRRMIHLPFQCNARVETVDEETVDMLKTAGCVSVALGVESGNEWLRVNILNRTHSDRAIQ